MKPVHYVSPEHLSLERIEQILSKGYLLELSEESKARLERSRLFLEARIQDSDELYYGINTGFGGLCDVRISGQEVVDLQNHLVKSHSVGTGEVVPDHIVKLMLLLKIQSLSYGFSGIQPVTVERLIEFFNYDLLPVVFEQGSLGASGDLAPLAHLSLPLLGLGEVKVRGKRLPAAHALNQLFWKPLRLQEKEGLALLNGTQFSLAYAVWGVLQGRKLWKLANLCAALAIDAFNCRFSPFDRRVHEIRPHPGQIETAQAIRKLLLDSELLHAEKYAVQDPYAFRCVPQVHGATYQALAHAAEVVTTEVNSVTDNPSLFPEDEVILSGGNFHAQPLALVLDYLAIALAELGSISERRTFQLLSGQRGLPPFLTPKPGLHSGLMIAQYTAAAIVSQNKQLCSPASVDSIVSSNGQEDHVSMAANAGTKLYRVLENVERVLAIEFMTAAQALEFRRPKKTSPELEEIVAEYRRRVPMLEDDRVLAEDLQHTLSFLEELLQTPPEQEP